MQFGGSLDEKTLGQRLQAARQAAGLTQQALCQQANLSYSTLAKIERGAIKAPSIFTIQNIATALNTSLDALLGIENVQAAQGRTHARSKSGISFVYFDINGCLVRFFHRAFTHLSEVTNQPPDAIETAFWHYNDQVCRGEMSMGEFNAALAEQLHLPNLDWPAYYLKAVEPIAESRELLNWVSQQGYGVGLLTNIMPGLVDAMKQRDLIPNIAYDAIVDSSEVHAIKPETKIYEVAMERAGVPAAEILLVDDSRPNLMAAEHLGWHVLWFDDYRPDESAKKVRTVLEPVDNASVPNPVAPIESVETPTVTPSPVVPEAPQSQPTEAVSVPTNPI